MVVRYNLGSIISSIGKNNYTPPNKSQIGRVYGVVTTENTPTKKQFERAGGFSGIGTIFYLDYAQSKNIVGNIDDDFYDTCKPAKPLSPQDQYYPVNGELVFIEQGPSPVSQISNTAGFKYYSIINLWNNSQQNAQPANNDASLGLTFCENPDVRPLIPYDGDNILGGRQGSSLRFTSTTRGVTPENEWSEIGVKCDPITILTNGLDYDPNKNYYIEQINKDKSSIYLTSAQKIPLITDKTGVLNNLTNPLNVPDYINSQIILNSDRVVLNSKADDIMIFATKNIEINTKNIINLNADERVHLNANTVFLGPYPKAGPQPVLLGWETYKVFKHLTKTLSKLSSQLSSAVSTQEGSAITSLQVAGKELSSNIKKLNKLLKNIPSKNVFTS
jgi:hypothetical protein